ncbi:MAG: response regulator transcription factor [Bacteroidetes bacterium]|nr:response regulator transcription factor [Bacteroidota bacterium]
MNILVIEDEQNVASFIKKGLEENGMHVILAFDGETGLSLLEQQEFSVIILDVILPNINGWDVCQRIRKQLRLKTPVLMLTALSSTDNLVKGLDQGADDYLAKPFKFHELLARVKALDRRNRNQIASPSILKFEDLEMDTDQKMVKRAGKVIKLTSREYNLLEFFLKNPHKVISRMDILENVWGVNFDFGTNVVDVYVNYLRNKMDKNFDTKIIQTVVGMGYILRSGS